MSTTKVQDQLNEVLRSDANFSRLMNESNEAIRAARNGDYSKAEAKKDDPNYFIENTAAPVVAAIEHADLTDSEKKELAYEALRQAAEATADAVKMIDTLSNAEAQINQIAMIRTLASILRKTGPVTLTPSETMDYGEASRLLHHNLTRDEDGTPRITYTVDLFSSEGGFHVPGNASVN